MTPQDNGRERLQGLEAGAVEAEADPDRHRKEEAVLATVAKVGLADQSLWQGFAGLTWSRSDFAAIKEGVWKCIMDAVAVHPDTVRDRLPEGSAVPDAVLSGILDGSKAVDVTVAREYIGTLAAFDKRRRALLAGHDFLHAVEAGDVDAAAGGLLKTVCDLVTSKGLVKTYQTEDVDALGFLDALAARRADGRAWLGLDCGFNHLNEVLNGLTEGVFILAGAPSTGKTTLAKQIADHVARVEQIPVLFFSFEQSKEELRIKSLARLASVDSRTIWKGRTDAETWAKVEEAEAAYRAGPGRCLTIIEAGRTDTVEAIRTAALMAKHKAGGDKKVLLVLDYLQIVPTPEGVRAEGIKDKVDWNLSELRRLARDLKSPVLVISSENRAAYAGNKTPTLAALKESGGIEYSADVVLCLWRDNKETARMEQERARRPDHPKDDPKDDPKAIRVEVYVLKNRNGELAKVKLNFTPAWASFDIEGQAESLDWSAALGE